MEGETTVSSSLSMEALLVSNPTRLLHPSPLPRITRCPIHPKPSILPLPSPRRSTGSSKSPPRSSPASNPPCFNGWEDVAPSADDIRSDAIRHLMISIGLCGRKDAILICIGFVCALAISRIRFSLVAIVPMSVLAFMAGLSIGGGGDRWQRVSGGGSNGKGGDLVGFFEFLDSKVDELKGVVEAGDMGRVPEVLEAVRAAAAPVKEAVGEYVSWRGDGEMRSSQKAGSRKRDSGPGGFDFAQVIASLGEVLLSRKPVKSRESSACEAALEQLNAVEKNGQSGELKESTSSSIPISELDGTEVGSSSVRAYTSLQSPSDDVMTKGSIRSGGVMGENANVEDESEVLSSKFTGTPNAKPPPHYNQERFDDGMLPFEEERASVNRMLRFTNRSRFEEMVLEEKSYRKEATVERHSEGVSKTNGSVNQSLSESGSALHREMEIHDKSYLHSSGRKVIDGFSEENSQDLPYSHQDDHNLKSYDASSASHVPSDEEFNRNVKEAVYLLKQAKEHLKNEKDEEEAEISLYKSASLLSTAVALKPRSLLAVGQLGNTYLLHGELKLKISRDLRTLLSSKKGRRLQLKGLNKQSPSKEKVASILVDICEECEELLVKAGKTYRMALSIDESDIRALYNWGLALTFRAQLIGDIGPEAAFDADKVYLAAIDKFSALTSRSHTCSPEALYRWGLALQQRSRLRSPDSREKIKLLKQAKSLFEDVLCSDTDSPIVREALFSCISELNFYRQLK